MDSSCRWQIVRPTANRCRRATPCSLRQISISCKILFPPHPSPPRWSTSAPRSGGADTPGNTPIRISCRANSASIPGMFKNAASRNRRSDLAPPRSRYCRFFIKSASPGKICSPSRYDRWRAYQTLHTAYPLMFSSNPPRPRYPFRKIRPGYPAPRCHLPGWTRRITSITAAYSITRLTRGSRF